MSATDASSVDEAVPSTSAVDQEGSGLVDDGPDIRPVEDSPPQDAVEDPSSSATDALDETDRLDPAPSDVTLADGTRYRLVPMKTRQFFAMLRIVTAGGATVLPNLRMSGVSEEQFTTQLIGLIVFAIPEAVDETIDFIRTMLEPEDFPTGDKKRDRELFAEMDQELRNPEIEDLFTIVEAVIRREAPDLKALGKRLMSMWNLAAASNQNLPSIPSSEAGQQLST